ncbi:MAG: hypothetical protein QG583_348 [Patescibacteria group bacterium]|jgi:hypothetical protein|nr:hypothetical protein [Patescibacteria group bacterium]
MEIFLLVYPKYNTETCNLTLQGKRDAKKFFNIVDPLIPAQDKINVLHCSVRHIEEIARMINYNLGEGEKDGDPLNLDKFSEKDIMYLEVKNVQSAILVCHQPIPYLERLMEKEPEVVKNLFPLNGGYALHLKVSSGSYATSIKTTTRNKIHLN